MKYAIGNAQHIGGRKAQMDAFGFSNPNDPAFVAHGGLLAVVADGIGSLEGSGAASKAAVRAFVKAYERKTEPESIQQALSRAFAEAVAQVKVAAETNGDVGTTLVAAVVAQNSLHWISAGDSVLLLIRNGSANQVNSPHILANRLDHDAAENRISLQEARENPDRESLTSYLGAEPPAEIDRNLRPLELLSGDRVVLCSDGLSKVVSLSRISSLCEGTPQHAAESLLAEALKNGGDTQDNTTVLVFWQDPDPAPVPDSIPGSGGFIEERKRNRRETPKIRKVPWMVALILCMLIAAAWFVHMWRARHAQPADAVKVYPTYTDKAAPPKFSSSQPAYHDPNHGDPPNSPHRGDPNALPVDTPASSQTGELPASEPATPRGKN